MTSKMEVNQKCKPEAGAILPVINRNRCEAKEKCTAVCPYDVFEIRKLDDTKKSSLSLFARLKVRAHGNRQAFVVRASECHACTECVKACPEKAIHLENALPLI